MNKTAIIGGTGMEKLPADYTAVTRVMENRHGRAVVHEVSGVTGDLVFLSRHGESHGIAPHEINYRANIVALAELGVNRILAGNAVGSLRLDLPPDSLVAVDDFLDFTRGRPLTLFDMGDGIRHTDFSEPYCPQLRDLLMLTASESGMELLPRGTYVCADGPRFESPAEVRMFAQLGGDVVGMTGIPEAVFAREAGICYAAVAIATNYAAGLTAESVVDHSEVVSRMALSADRVRELFVTAASRLQIQRTCNCATAVSTQP